jgi:hypothetical protein
VRKTILKRVQKARVENDPLQFVYTEAGITLQYFLVTLLALLFILFLTNTGILGIMGLKT